MCKNKTLKSSGAGYVLHCRHCDKIQISFGTTIMSMTPARFYDFIKLVDELYSIHNLYPNKEEKTVKMPTPARDMLLVYTVNELKALLLLLIDGRNKMEHDKVFVFNGN